MELLTLNAKLVGDRVTTEVDFVELFDKIVNERKVTLLKGAFPPELCLGLREKVFNFGQLAERESVEYPGRSFHRFDHLNAASMTKHVFHGFNFDLPDPTLPADLSTALEQIFEPMRELQQAVSMRPLPKTMGHGQGLRLHPQVIHYPRGGGYFDYHIHPYEPQRVGLILNMSKRGHDYHSGGTLFRYRSKVVDIGASHDMGDVAIFRYDLLHSANSVDPEVTEVDFKSNSGKWSLILPYY